MDRDLPRKLISLSDKPTTGKRSRHGRPQRLRPVYRLATVRDSHSGRGGRESRNKENEGFRWNATAAKRPDFGNVHKGCLQGGDANAGGARRGPFALKSSVINFEKKSVFGDMPFVRSKAETRDAASSQKGVIVRKGHPKSHGVQCREENSGSERSAERLDDGSKQRESGSHTADLESKTRNQDKNGGQEGRVGSPGGSPKSEKFSLFGTISGIGDAKDHCLVGFESQHDTSGTFSGEVSTIDDNASKANAHFIKPILDVLRDSDTPEMLIHEELLSKFQVIDPGQAGSPRSEGESSAESPEAVLDAQRPCFLDQSGRQSPAPGKAKKKRRVRQDKKTTSLKEKFKRLHRLKRLGRKENCGKVRADAQPFHPAPRPPVYAPLQQVYKGSATGFFFGRHLGYASAGFYAQGLESEPFQGGMHNFRFMRGPFRHKRKADGGFCRREARAQRQSAPERTEDYSNKYKTEICKNFELTGECQWRDMVGKRANQSAPSRTD